MQNYIQRQECTVEYSILPIIQYYKIKYSSFLFPSQSEQVNCDIQHVMNSPDISSHSMLDCLFLDGLDYLLITLLYFYPVLFPADVGFLSYGVDRLLIINSYLFNHQPCPRPPLLPIFGPRGERGPETESSQEREESEKKAS